MTYRRYALLCAIALAAGAAFGALYPFDPPATVLVPVTTSAWLVTK